MDKARYQCLGIKDRIPIVPAIKVLNFLRYKKAEFYQNFAKDTKAIVTECP